MARVAILIDGDNISADHAEQISAIGQSRGDVILRRAYANASNGCGWNEAPGVRLMHAGTGKNAADLLLAIDAIEYACTDRFDTFVLASSDGDFTHLATRLRERELEVIGAGEDKAPAPFRAACNRFQVLAAPRPTDGAAARAEAAPVSSGHAISELDRSIRAIIKRDSVNGSGIPLTALNTRMFREHDVIISDRPERTWRNYLAERPALFALDPPGKEARVRFLPAGFRP